MNLKVDIKWCADYNAYYSVSLKIQYSTIVNQYVYTLNDRVEYLEPAADLEQIKGFLIKRYGKKFRSFQFL